MTQLIYTAIICIGFTALSEQIVSGFAVEPFEAEKQYKEVLDNNGKYVLSWSINELTSEITFEMEVDTLGYVGLGISSNGKMDGSDLFIAGVVKTEEGNSMRYSYDYHGVGHRPVPDDTDNWELLSASENGTHTYIKVKRLLNTCDNQDFPITSSSTSRVLWSIGSTDSLEKHAEKGAKSVSLIPFPEPEVDIEKMEKWHIHVNMTMPSADTSYWCTIHKRPKMDKLHHAIGFDAVLETVEAIKHTHHFLVSRCVPPAGHNADEIFGKFVGHDGAECYSNNGTFPSEYCEEYLFVWAVGGKRTLFPLHVGYPIGGDDESVYYMLEIHYDNPDKISGLIFDTGLQIFYTDELRENNATMLRIGHDSTPTMIVPPNQSSFVISGHCPMNCTRDLIGAGGIKVFNILLHSHLSGRKLKVRHFRDEVELPWIAFDDNYDFNFQQNQNLQTETEILPGDHLTYECTYDSTWAEGIVVPGGLSTREEMCISFLWVYGDSTMEKCLTSYPMDNLVGDFGVTNYTIGGDGARMVINITEPEELRGDFIDVLNNVIDWTPALVNKIQVNHQYGDHVYYCVNQGESEGIYGYTKYPEINSLFEPEDECAKSSTEWRGSSTETSSSTSNTNINLFYLTLTILTYIYFQLSK